MLYTANWYQGCIVALNVVALKAGSSIAKLCILFQYLTHVPIKYLIALYTKSKSIEWSKYPDKND